MGDALEEVQAELRERYRLVGRLGAGGGGETFEALRSADGVRVAVKRLVLGTAEDWKTVELFEREARVLAGLQHPAIPRFHESFVEGKSLYLVHDFAPGRSLRSWLEAGWRPDEAEVTRVAEFLLDVLVHLHGLHPPLVHRDIKPDNVVRSDDGRLWLLDFGAVRDVASTTSAGGSTVVGTYGYMAPEQFRGHAVPATDLYGVAATVLHLLSGRPPVDFPQEKLKVVFRPIVTASPKLLAWLDRALEPAPEDRFPSAAAALDALHHGVRPAVPPGSTKPATRSVRIGVILAAVGAGLVVAAGIGAVGIVKARASRAGALPPAAVADGHETALLWPRPLSLYQPITYESQLEGHMNMVTSLAVSPDDKTLVSGSDASAKLWNLATGDAKKTLGGHDGKVMGVVFTKDGSQVLTGGGTSIRVWDVAKGTLVRTIDHPHADGVMGLALSPDDKTLYSAGYDGIAKAWDFASGRELRAFPHGGKIYSLALAPSAATLVTGARDGSIKIWHAPTARLVGTLAGPKGTIASLAFAPDGTILAAASDDHHTWTWSVQNGQTFEPYQTIDHDADGWGVGFTPDGRLLVSGSKDGQITITDAMNRKVLSTINSRAFAARSVFTSDGRTMLIEAGTNIARYRVAARGSKTVLPQLVESRVPREATPTAEEALYRDAMTLITTSKLDEATAKLDELARSHPRSPLAAVGRARLTVKRAFRTPHGFDKGEEAKALAQLEEAAALGKKGAEWWGTRASIARARRDFPTARDAIRAAYAIAPKDTYTAIIEMVTDYEEGRYHDAIAIGDRVVPVTPQPELRAWAYEFLASTHEVLGDLDAAEAAHKKRIELLPNDAAPRVAYAYFLLKSIGDIEAGVAESDRARAVADTWPARTVVCYARTEKATSLLWDRRDAQAAMRELDAGIAAAPTHHAHFARAATFRYLALRDHDPKLVDKAREDMRAAIKLDPSWEPYKGLLTELDAVEREARKPKAPR